MGRLPGVGDGVWLGGVLSASRLRVSSGDFFDVLVLVRASLGSGVRGALVLPLMALLGPALEQRAGLVARATTTLFALALGGVGLLINIAIGLEIVVCDAVVAPVFFRVDAGDDRGWLGVGARLGVEVDIGAGAVVHFAVSTGAGVGVLDGSHLWLHHVEVGHHSRTQDGHAGLYDVH